MVLFNPGELYPLAPHSHVGLILIGPEGFEVSVARYDKSNRREVILNGSFPIERTT